MAQSRMNHCIFLSGVPKSQESLLIIAAKLAEKVNTKTVFRPWGSTFYFLFDLYWKVLYMWGQIIKCDCLPPACWAMNCLDPLRQSRNALRPLTLLLPFNLSSHCFTSLPCLITCLDYLLFISFHFQTVFLDDCVISDSKELWWENHELWSV